MSGLRATPGPWHYKPVDDEHGNRIVDRIVAGTGVIVWDVDDPRDAPLIAAAPELYQALSNLIENPLFQVAVGGNPIVVDRMLESARAALAKARGYGHE